MCKINTNAYSARYSFFTQITDAIGTYIVKHLSDLNFH